MLAVRYVALVALVVWLGGMIVLGAVVAPSTFRVLQASEAAAGRALAGAVFGDVLRHFHLAAYACGGVLVLCLIVQKLVGPPPSAFPIRLSIVAFMLALDVYSGVVVSGEIARVQSEVSVPISSLPVGDPQRSRFDQLHARSTTLMTIEMALGLVLLFWYARE
jgi:uncharacterized protein DUF4149